MDDWQVRALSRLSNCEFEALVLPALAAVSGTEAAECERLPVHPGAWRFRRDCEQFGSRGG